MENQFMELGLNEALLNAVKAMGFETPTEVQRRAIPFILDNRDVIVRSKTGSGKTGAFSLPILHRIQSGELALILTPTRELALQIDADIALMKKFMDTRTTVVYGQHNMNKETEELVDAQIITGTPGRVWDHIQQGNIDVKRIKYMVLDEADRMLDMGFFDQVVRIVKKTPEDRATMLFSATMPPEISKLAKRYMQSPEIIEIISETKTVDTIKQSYFRIERDEKQAVLDRVLKFYQPDSCMIFCNTRIAVDKVDVFLKRKGYHSDALHGANTQNSRTRTLQRFKKGDRQILVATDVAARGLHVEDLSLVINYDVPNDKDNYIHRIGRTGRAGNGGIAISFVTKDEIMSLYEIEEHVGVLIDDEEPPTEEMANQAVEASESKWKHRKRYEHKEVKESFKEPREQRERAKGDMDKAQSRKKPKPKHKGDEHKKSDLVEGGASPKKVVKNTQKVPMKPQSKSSERDVESKNPIKTENNPPSKYKVKIESTSKFVASQESVSKQNNPIQNPAKTETQSNKGILAKIKQIFKKA